MPKHRSISLVVARRHTILPSSMWSDSNSTKLVELDRICHGAVITTFRERRMRSSTGRRAVGSVGYTATKTTDWSSIMTIKFIVKSKFQIYIVNLIFTIYTDKRLTQTTIPNTLLRIRRFCNGPIKVWSHSQHHGRSGPTRPVELSRIAHRTGYYVTKQTPQKWHGACALLKDFSRGVSALFQN